MRDRARDPEREPDRPERPAPTHGPTDLREIARAVGNRAFTQHVRALQRQPAEGGYDFSDDPLSAESGGGLAVKPGPVRSYASLKLTNKQGQSFDGGGNKQPLVWAKGFLSFFGFRPGMPGVSAITDQYWFNDRSATLTEVINTLEAQAGFYGVRLDRATAMQAATSAMPAGGAGATKSQVAIYMAISFTRTTHFTPSTGQRSAPDPPGVQGAIQATWELHPDGKPGAEVTWVGQVALGQDPGSPDKGFKVQSLLSGPQAAYVIPFLNGTLQLAPVIQMLAGVQRVQHEDRIYRLVPTTQVGAGGQAVYTIPGTKGHLQIGGQAAAAITDPARADLTADYGYQVFLQWKF